MNTDKPSLSIGEMSKKAIVERAEKRVPPTVNQPYHVNIHIEKEILREQEEVFKKDFMGSPWDFLKIEDAGVVLGYLIFVLLIVSTYGGMTQFFLLLGLGIILTLFCLRRIEYAYRSGADSEWYVCELEYRDALQEIKLRIEETRPKRNN